MTTSFGAEAHGGGDEARAILQTLDADKISREDIRCLDRSLRDVVFTCEEVREQADPLLWLNGTFELLGMADLRYEAQDDSPPQGHPAVCPYRSNLPNNA